jgi:hypothetical protein
LIRTQKEAPLETGKESQTTCLFLLGLRFKTFRGNLGEWLRKLLRAWENFWEKTRATTIPIFHFFMLDSNLEQDGSHP